MNEQEQLDRFAKQQSDLWREFRDYQQQAISISIDQEELQAQARERGIPPERDWEVIREAALELRSHVMSNSVNGSTTEPPQKPSWWKVISPEDDQRRTMDAFDPIRPMAQEYKETRSQVLAITSCSDPERLEILRKKDAMLMACLDGAAGDLQISLTLLARTALIFDGAEPPETRFPKIVRDVLGTPRLKKRSEDVHEQERSAEIYHAGSKFTELQYSKLDTPELLDPDFKLSRDYIQQGILGKNADREITARLKTESNRIGLTPKRPVDEEEAKLLDHIRRYPKEIEPESSDDLSDSADDEFVELAIPLVSHGKMGMPLIAQIEHDEQMELICEWLVEFESSLTDRLRPLHQLHFGDTGIGLTEARKQLRLNQSDENNYRNRWNRFCEKKAKQMRDKEV